MKLTHFWGLSLGLAVGYATAADSSYDASTGTGTVWAKGVYRKRGGMMPIKMTPLMVMLMI